MAAGGITYKRGLRGLTVVVNTNTPTNNNPDIALYSIYINMTYRRSTRSRSHTANSAVPGMGTAFLVRVLYNKLDSPSRGVAFSLLVLYGSLRLFDERQISGVDEIFYNNDIMHSNALISYFCGI